MVDRLRWRLKQAGARAIIVCQLKPMQVADVSPFNSHLDNYLREEKARGRQGFGCRTQIRLNYLKHDGFHIKPDYVSVIDRTYACAIRGVKVPDPTPIDGFVPDSVRQRWEAEWPGLTGRCQMNKDGW